MLLLEATTSSEIGVLVGEYEQFLSGKAEGTREAYLRTVRHLIGWLTHHPDTNEPFQPSQLTRTEVEHYLSHLEQEGLSLAHRTRVKSTISHFARFLIEEKGLLRRNPTRGLELPPVPKAPAQPLSPEQRVSLVAVVEQKANQRGTALFALAYWAGCRVSEISWLKLADTHVDAKQGWLRVGTKQSQQRDITLLNHAHQPVYDYLQATRDTERPYVFVSQRSERLTEEAIHYWFRTLKEQATLDQMEVIENLTFHDLRTDFAQRAREAGWSLEKVACYLGIALI